MQLAEDVFAFIARHQVGTLATLVVVIVAAILWKALEEMMEDLRQQALRDEVYVPEFTPPPNRFVAFIKRQREGLAILAVAGVLAGMGFIFVAWFYSTLLDIASHPTIQHLMANQ